MKKLLNYYLLLSAFIVLPGLAQAVNGYTITGNIRGVIDGKKAYLFFDSKLQNPLDSAQIKNGYFKFQGSVTNPHLYNIVISEAGNRRGIYPAISLFVENSSIIITADIDSIPTSDLLKEGTYPYNKIKITGSKSQELFLKYFNDNSALKKKITEANRIYLAYLKSRQGTLKKNIDEGIQAIIPIDFAREERLRYIKNFIKDNKQNAVSLAVVQMNLNYFSAKEIDTLLSNISEKLKDSQDGLYLIKDAAMVERTAIGSGYVDFSFLDKDNNNITLSDYLGKGKYVLLEFWASWCGPCIKDLPHLKEIYKLYHPLNFEIIQISMDDNRVKWLRAVEDQQMEWLQVSDLKAFNGALSKLYNFDSIPTSILINPNGVIVTRNMRGSWMDKILIELYGNKFVDK